MKVTTMGNRLTLPIYRHEPLTKAVANIEHSTWKKLQGARILITGATGFFGVWTLSAIAHLNAAYHLGIRVQAASRNPTAFLEQHPEFKEVNWLHWLTSDILDLAENAMSFAPTHVLHMAASADAKDYLASAAKAFMTIVGGTEQAIAVAKHHHAHLHFVSSGAIYGSRVKSQGPFTEGQELLISPDPLNPSQAYANAKRAAESLIACSFDNWSISRPFAFLGPHLPLYKHFAAGNFVADVLHQHSVVIKGDGTPLRSYMHPADLAAWTLGLCALKPRKQAINVGSDQAFALKHWASLIQSFGSASKPVMVMKEAENSDASAYWPSIEKAKSLGLTLSLPITQSIEDTLRWAELSHTP